MNKPVVLFGEAQKGEYNAAYLCDNLAQLSDFLGEPPTNECKGLQLAIQMLMYNLGVVYFRVHEEGFSTEDYLRGLNFLENRDLFPQLSAICLPGVGNANIIDATTPLCEMHKSFLILTEHDLYDYLTCRGSH